MHVKNTVCTYVHTPSTCRTPHSYAVPVLSSWHQCTLCDGLPTLCDAPPTLCDVPLTLCPPGVGWTSSECGSQCQALGWNSQHQVRCVRRCASLCVCMHAHVCLWVGVSVCVQYLRPFAIITMMQDIRTRTYHET